MKPYDWQDDPEMATPRFYVGIPILHEKIIPMPEHMPIPVETVIESVVGYVPEVTGRK
jgi:hypothetical protein